MDTGLHARIIGIFIVSLASILMACGSGGGDAPATTAPPANLTMQPTATSSSASPTTDSSSASSGTVGKPEKNELSIAVAAISGSVIPLLVAQDAGYFDEYGLTVSITKLTADAATAGLVSGDIDIYNGGAAAISAHVRGSDIIYVGAPIDTSPLVLEVAPDIEKFTDLRGKVIATTAPGAFGEVLIRKLADENNMVVGEDIELLYSKDNQGAVAQLLNGAASAAIVTSPATLVAEQNGFKPLIDFSKEDVRIIGPGVAVFRNFAESNPNTIKAYLSAYLKGTKRALDDPQYAKQVLGEQMRTADSETLDRAYEDNKELWNKDMTVHPEPIELVLQYTPSLADAADKFRPDEFFDNKYIADVNACLGKQLFPEVEFAAIDDGAECP